MPSSNKTLSAEFPRAQAVELGSLVDYAEGSIVSRTLADSDAGTITLFAFDAGQALSEHSAPFDALVVVLDGRAELTIAGEAISVGVGQAAAMPADVPHSVEASQRFKMLLTMLRVSGGK